jgi:hypothetical protein
VSFPGSLASFELSGQALPWRARVHGASQGRLGLLKWAGCTWIFLLGQERSHFTHACSGEEIDR